MLENATRETPGVVLLQDSVTGVLDGRFETRRFRVPAGHAVLFVQRYGCAPLAWLTRERMAHARHLLRTTSASVATIAEQCGYASSQAQERQFRRAMGCTPSVWRRSA